ncbi:hypothetical protein PCC6912_50830 [Chlorogloeopsis fritschii PCC 6912]|uniref:HTH cro/C1-type domain-containing protein n=1 Tax=Chlorogloeopsis fritschii PCC 6912 TaxID=211165 RepID=A0A3S0XQY5_CHLFR|nr:transcriptional regulator [Chlorogloeopsis fritschii]RUR74905.1 hypothetical protein PCC6912_50830 [Chlorogloeopsis fritschii PCC 6912]
MATFKEKKRLSDIVQEIRGDKSQRALASQLDVSWTAIQNWENPTSTSFPNDGSLLKLADAKGWSLEEIKRYLATGKRPQITEIDRLIDQILRLHPHEIVQVQRALAERLEEIFRIISPA